MNEEEAMRLLQALLDGAGAEWTEERGWLRFRLRRDAMLWECACRPCADRMLIYGRFPFRCGDPDRARQVCEEYNRQLVRGALFLAEDGCPVYRCSADTDDIYAAEDRLAAALRCCAQVMAHCWGRLSGI